VSTLNYFIFGLMEMSRISTLSVLLMIGIFLIVNGSQYMVNCLLLQPWCIGEQVDDIIEAF